MGDREGVGRKEGGRGGVREREGVAVLAEAHATVIHTTQ